MKPSDVPYYEADGIRYPRVTAILSILRNPDLEDWQAKVGMAAARRKCTHAERVGRTLDAMIKRCITGDKVVLPRQPSADVRQGWKAWMEYTRLHPTRFRVGSILTSEQYGYGGAPDLVEPFRITDIKATTHLQDRHWIQVMAYVPLAFSPHQWEQVTVQLIRLDTFLGTYEAPPARPFNPTMWETFLKLKDVYVEWFMTKEVQNVADH